MNLQHLLFILTITTAFSCHTEAPSKKYKTENVIVIVIDGARYSETWGDSTHQYVPQLANTLAPQGIINTNFYNDGPTHTTSGHTSISTGVYQEIDNSGAEIPRYPSFFQCWNNDNPLQSNNKTWLITSKDKLEVLNNCTLEPWENNHQPSHNCGYNGNRTGYRHDSITFQVTIDTLSAYHPNLVLINFREPDYSGHRGNWTNYVNGIKSSDDYAARIWDFIQNDSIYKDNTTLFITNDHGRHLDNVANGFPSHGDNCMGCRHINFFATGPDFKQNLIITQERSLIDIPATIAELLQFEMRYCRGDIMKELFKSKSDNQ